jgi:hypothetical protein
MTALHAAPTLRALANMDREATDERALHGQFFLILGGDAHRADRAVTVRTRVRQRRDVLFVHVRRRRPMRAGAIGGAGLASRSLRRGDARATREGRRLAIDGTARGVEFVLQLLVFTTQALPLRFRAAEILAQTLVLAAQLVDRLLRITRRGIRGVSDRTCMPDPSPVEKYKRTDGNDLTR